MKTFKGFNQNGRPCPICNGNEDKECTLIAMPETAEGGNVEALAVHTGCLELVCTLLPDGRRMIHHIDPVEVSNEEV